MSISVSVVIQKPKTASQQKTLGLQSTKFGNTEVQGKGFDCIIAYVDVKFSPTIDQERKP